MAATISVTNHLDEVTGGNGCSLREAISAANGNNSGPGGDCAKGDGVDLIKVPASAAPYTLSRAGAYENANATGDLDITSVVTIVGGGASSTTVDAKHLDRVFHVLDSGIATFAGLAVTGGVSPPGFGGSTGPDNSGTPGANSDGGTGGAGSDGGGVLNDGALTLDHVRIHHNATGSGGRGGDGGSAGPVGNGDGGQSRGGAGGPGGSGGGVASTGSSLAINASRIDHNRTGKGGTAGAAGTGGVGISAPTGGNGGVSFGGTGGASGSGGGIVAIGNLTVTGSVVSGNATGDGGNGGNGGTGGTGGTGTTEAGGQGGPSIGGFGGSGAPGGGIVAAAAAIRDTTVRANRSGRGGNGAAGGRAGDGGPGATATGPEGVGGGGFGGDGGGEPGIYSVGLEGFSNPSAVYERVTVSENTAGDGGTGGAGGGGPSRSDGGQGGQGGRGSGLAVVIYNPPAGQVTVTVRNATLAYNRGGDGGSGGARGATGSSPGAGGFGGNGTGADLRVPAPSGFSPTPLAGLTHVTIASNGPGTGGAAGQGGTLPGPAGLGAGVEASGNIDVTLTNVLLASNGVRNCWPGGFHGTHNLSFPSDSKCPGASVTANPLLGALQDNGGPTQTMAIPAASPAFDAVPSTGAGCLATDQRGITRPRGRGCEIGAFELTFPAAATGGVAKIAPKSAAVKGLVHPGSTPTSFRFDFGPRLPYGSHTPPSPAGSAYANTRVRRRLTGLKPNTLYHYRVFATNVNGSAAGLDRTFRTLPRFAGVRILTPAAKLNAKNRVAIALRCQAKTFTACKGTLNLTKSTKPRSLSSKGFRIAPGKTVTLTLTLPKDAAKAIRNHQPVQATATAAGRDGEGTPRTTTRKVALTG
ncbi:MAG TPA: fibronectin type III domain-containing protein [Thermoleophilaceae bacterium]|nr:fibronectin type III domain-containing protein [Thermoleophilaceae bacterium]